MSGQQASLRPAEDVQAVVFDLGGVLVRLGGPAQLAELCGGLPLDELWTRWLSCRWVRAHERGRCTSEEFAAGLVADWGLPIEPAAFLDAFRGWPRGPEPGARELVEATGRVATTACLSNTNALHWSEQRGGEYGFEALFDHRFLSHEIGMVKPDAEVFAHVSDRLGAPEHLLFLDDALPNVEAARRAGWRAEQVRGTVEARAALARHGVLAAAR